MPTYEYVCSKCGHKFEKYQSIKDNALKTCPKELCAKKKWGKGAVQRQISSGSGLLFKGSGFYITDYRSEGYKQSAKKDVAKPASSESKSAPAPASKPAKPAKP